MHRERGTQRPQPLYVCSGCSRGKRDILLTVKGRLGATRVRNLLITGMPGACCICVWCDANILSYAMRTATLSHSQEKKFHRNTFYFYSSVQYLKSCSGHPGTWSWHVTNQRWTEKKIGQALNLTGSKFYIRQKYRNLSFSNVLY